MAARKPFSIAGQRIPLGQSRTLFLKFSESYLGSPISIPIQVLRAPKPGPTVLLTGSVHGDELNGMGTIRELLYNHPPQLVKGTLVCVPVVNVYGLEHHTRDLPDRRDLNRSFPGSPTGSLSSRLANLLFTEVISHCDFLIDFHSAAIRRTNFPNIRADLNTASVRPIARAFGCELVVNGAGPIGSLRRAATSAGIPCVNLEAGEVWKIEPDVVKVGVLGVHNVLKYLDMVQGEPEPPRYQIRIEKTTWIRAEKGGTLSFSVNSGDIVEKGQELAVNYDIFGHSKRPILAPGDGIIIGMSTMPVVKPGDPMFHLALLSRRTINRIRKRIQEDLEARS